MTSLSKAAKVSLASLVLVSSSLLSGNPAQALSQHNVAPAVQVAADRGRVDASSELI